MKTIVLCSSTVFYDHVAELADELDKMGLHAVVPTDAENIRRGISYDVATAKTWYQNSADFVHKAAFIHDHFDKVAPGDAVLVVND